MVYGLRVEGVGFTSASCCGAAARAGRFPLWIGVGGYGLGFSGLGFGV